VGKSAEWYGNPGKLEPVTESAKTKQVKWEDMPSNFRGSNGKIYLVRCPVCKTENYAMNVATGICTWCGWDANENDRKKE
jgi:hypothetical protein